ncbi:putative sulfite oxidase subunit YedZ [compost metagenome]
MGHYWQALHRTVYVVAALSVWHFWLVRAGKNDFFEPYVYGIALAVLLLFRLGYFIRRRTPE